MSYFNSINGSATSPAPHGRYRILCRRANGTVGLVRLCTQRSDACRIARSLVDRHLTKLRLDLASVLADSARPREVYIEQWVGHATDGHWAVVSQCEGGYRFEFFDRRVRSCQPEKSATNGSSVKQAEPSVDAKLVNRAPRAGDVVQCVLLEKRTRKNGWFAKIVDQPASGPITGEVPAELHLEAGRRVHLKICGIKLETSFVQLAWVPQPSEKAKGKEQKTNEGS
ncbi:MAG TPA: hypothetical protein PKD64_13425 [Pirellulaceae bacterium]|nr:hypothetical protein [Pirellulaceae bacterium]HMO93188.1 hypothetical protein [Pirellulaceae bacterium]HMP69983.1 hypothetical protein [Pirellulaceae bacterium]